MISMPQKELMGRGLLEGGSGCLLQSPGGQGQETDTQIEGRHEKMRPKMF